MINSKTMTEPKTKTLQLLQLPSLAEFIQNNSTDLIKLLELEPNKFTHMFTLEYDYDIAINNKVKHINVDDSIGGPYFANQLIICKRDNATMKDWAIKWLTKYYDHLVELQKQESNLLPTHENIGFANDAIKKGNQFFTPRAYIDWIVPELNNINVNYQINFDYMKHDRNYFANRMITQPHWEEDFKNSPAMQEATLQVLKLYRFEEPRSTPAIGLLLDRLNDLKVFGTKCAQLANSYFLGFQ